MAVKKEGKKVLEVSPVLIRDGTQNWKLLYLNDPVADFGSTAPIREALLTVDLPLYHSKAKPLPGQV